MSDNETPGMKPVGKFIWVPKDVTDCVEDWEYHLNTEHVKLIPWKYNLPEEQTFEQWLEEL